MSLTSPILLSLLGAAVGVGFILLVRYDASERVGRATVRRDHQLVRVIGTAALLASVAPWSGTAFPFVMLGFVCIRYPLLILFGGSRGS